MPIAATIEFDPADIRRLGTQLRAIQEFTGAELPKVVRNAGRDFTRAAWRLTPLSRPRYTAADFSRGGGVMITVRHRYTGATVRFVGSDDQLKKYGRPRVGDKIRGRGFAKIGWLHALVGLGVKLTGIAKNAGKGAEQAGEFIDGLHDARPYVVIANLVPYIEGLDMGTTHNPPYNIHGQAMREMIAKNDEILNRLAAKIGEKWKK